MFSATEINHRIRHRAYILIPALFIGTIVTLGYIGLVSLFRDDAVSYIRSQLGKTAADAAPIGLMLPLILPFLASLLFGEKRAKRFSIICPHCNEDLTLGATRVLATRCCKACDRQIVEGRKTFSEDVFQRHSTMKQRRLLVYWFWTWPALGAFILIENWFDPSSISNCTHILFLPGLIGSSATIWTYARTRDRRYLPQLCISIMVLGIGALEYWN